MNAAPSISNSSTVIGKGYSDRYLSDEEIRSIVFESFKTWDLSNQRVLAIIPDGTRTAPVPQFFHLFHEALSGKVKKLDFLVALGTHQPMSEDALNQHVGISAEERAGKFADVNIFNHHWENPENFVQLGLISSDETLGYSKGMLSLDVPVRVNRLVMDYDVLVVCGPVFPHEVVGFSGGNKYFFPGISGPEVINFSHWIGALNTIMEIIGTKHTPVREVINKAASFIPRQKLAFCMVSKHDGLSGLYVGTPENAWSTAADLSAQVHVKYVEKPFRQVLSVMPKMYDDLWTGGKGVYKLEPVTAEGGEITVFAPHITEVSYTHGAVLDEIGYHVRDYFVKQWDRFKGYPWGVLAHSTHVRGGGTYDNGVERPRMQVTLATGILKERCQKINLGYREYKNIRPEEWAGRESEGILLVPSAGEILYRLKK